MAVKNQKSALAALAAAAGLWAWQNRDTIRGWVNTQRSQMGGHGTSSPATGATQRIGEHYPSVSDALDTADPTAPRRYDPSI
jgi:hypothetical protein